jgi:FkbM family methyltransferase
MQDASKNEIRGAGRFARLLAPAIFYEDNEPQVQAAYFKSIPPGFFVDVGANDPVIYSQSYALEQRGWSGILVEPLPDRAQQLRARRKARVFELACSSPADDGKQLTFHVAGIFSSLRSQSVTAGVSPQELITVQAATLDRILREANAPIPIDFVSIDVEGHELAVLDGFDLAYWRPRLLLVEDLAMNLRLHRYLKSRGYAWFRRTLLNGWYAPRELAPPVSLLGRWQFFRKYYLSMPFRHLRELKRRRFGKPIDPDSAFQRPRGG